MSIGDGMNKSRRPACAALAVLEAEPQYIGWISLAMVRVRCQLDFLFGQVAFFKVLGHEFFRRFGRSFNHLSRHSLAVQTIQRDFTVVKLHALWASSQMLSS
jgi:hypothetical protein